MTKLNTTWDQARRRKLQRFDSMDKEHAIDRGVNYFVLKLESLGLQTFYSCEGHPRGFYVMFQANYTQALRIASCGYFVIEMCGDPNAHLRYMSEWPFNIEENHRHMQASPGWWVMRIGAYNEVKTERGKRQLLRAAAESWEENLQIEEFPS